MKVSKLFSIGFLVLSTNIFLGCDDAYINRETNTAHIVKNNDPFSIAINKGIEYCVGSDLPDIYSHSQGHLVSPMCSGGSEVKLTKSIYETGASASSLRAVYLAKLGGLLSAIKHHPNQDAAHFLISKLTTQLQSYQKEAEAQFIIYRGRDILDATNDCIIQRTTLFLFDAGADCMVNFNNPLFIFGFKSGFNDLCSFQTSELEKNECNSHLNEELSIWAQEIIKEKTKQ